MKLFIEESIFSYEIQNGTYQRNQQNIPIIAYSKSFAKAGALISLYSSVENVADKTVSVINMARTKKYIK